MTDKGSDVYLNETAARQTIALGVQRTTPVRVHRSRPVHVFEVDGKTAFRPRGVLLQPEPRGALTPLSLALERVQEADEQLVLVAGHHADAGVAELRASVVRALLAGDVDAFVVLAGANAGVAEWQQLLGWVARSRGVDCDPGDPDGQLGPNTRGALARFREASGLPAGNPDAPEPDDWRALARLIEDELAARTDDLPLGRKALRFVPPPSVSCAAAWPMRSVAILEHTTMADERVDVLCFRKVDAPKLACHAAGLAEKECDVYRKGKYRCEHCSPTETAGFVCLEVEGPHFDFDRSVVRPDGFPALVEVKRLLDEAPERRAMLHGHTDTVGDEAYNKLLSERRARAVLALLTHDQAAWDALRKAESWGDDVPRDVAEYVRGALPEPVAVERFHEFPGGGRFVGCGELNPVGDGTDERSRRVVVAVFDPGRGPRDLPCTVGDLKPCLASCRPPPQGPRSPRASFRCAVYRRLASLCSCKQTPRRPKKIVFHYGLDVAPGHPWTEAASIVVESEDGAEQVVAPLAEGALHGTMRFVELVVRPDVRYRGGVREGEHVIALFGPSELHDVASDEGEATHLAPPDRPPAPRPDPHDEVDHGLVRVKLHDDQGRAIPSTQFTVTIVGQRQHGISEMGFAGIRLPATGLPDSCTLEWGPVGADGRHPFRCELALDHKRKGARDQEAAMLNNLGYPRSRPLADRVRAFQADERLAERGLAPDGSIPPATRARIEQRYRERLR